MIDFIKELYPICRSITGNGVRETLRLIGNKIPLQIHEVPTGTKVLDWEIPRNGISGMLILMIPQAEKLLILKNLIFMC